MAVKAEGSCRCVIGYYLRAAVGAGIYHRVLVKGGVLALLLFIYYLLVFDKLIKLLPGVAAAAVLTAEVSCSGAIREVCVAIWAFIGNSGHVSPPDECIGYILLHNVNTGKCRKAIYAAK